MSNLNRLKKLPGSKTSGKKKTEPDSVSPLLEGLKAIKLAQQDSNTDVVEAIKQLSKIVIQASENKFNPDPVINAINELRDLIRLKMLNPLDYKIDFERDGAGRLKTGIELNAVSRKLN